MITKALRHALEHLDEEALAPPSGGRLGAALCLVRDLDDGDAEIVYTRRRDDLRSHPGQISFPGGRVDPGEGIVAAALREAQEEVALDPSTVTVLGRLPASYIPPSRFWLQTVCARWDAPHELVAAEAEVAEILWVRLSTLRDPSCLRAVQLSIRGWSWAWELGAPPPLWGATAMVTAALLDLVVPGWSGGREPSDLPPEQRLEPWLDGVGRGADVPRGGPARLRDVPARRLADLAAAPASDVPTSAAEVLDGASRAVADAVLHLAPGTARSDDEVDRTRDGPLRVVALAGSGRTGEVARLATVALTGHGVDAELVTLDGTLPPADVVIDGLVGRGLDGPGLAGRALRLMRALRESTPVVVSVDVPSGLDAARGLVGELVTADVTIALADVAAGLLLPGLGPFVGDLYLAPLAPGEPELVRVVGDDTSEGTWRE